MFSQKMSRNPCKRTSAAIAIGCMCAYILHSLLCYENYVAMVAVICVEVSRVSSAVCDVLVPNKCTKLFLINVHLSQDLRENLCATTARCCRCCRLPKGARLNETRQIQQLCPARVGFLLARSRAFYCAKFPTLTALQNTAACNIWAQLNADIRGQRSSRNNDKPRSCVNRKYGIFHESNQIL